MVCQSRITKEKRVCVEKNLASREWREIEFSLNMANKHPDQFMKLYKYDVVDNCTHVQEYPNELKKYPVYLQKIFTKKNNSTYCIRKVYSLVDTVLKDVIRRLTVKQIYSMIAQTTYIIYLMKEYGYTHNDFHTQNILLSCERFMITFQHEASTVQYILDSCETP